MNQAGIYRITIERPAGPMFYIGQAVILRKRRTQHLRALRRGAHKNQHLQRAFQKYGEQAFQFQTLLVCARSTDILEFYERRILDSYAPEQVYNVCRECMGSKLGVAQSVETRAKIGSGNRGKVRSPEHRDAVGRSNRSRIVSDETRAKMSASHMGNKHAQGHVQTAEHRKKVGAFFQGRKKPAEEIIRRLETRRRNRAAAGLDVY